MAFPAFHCGLIEAAEIVDLFPHNSNHSAESPYHSYNFVYSDAHSFVFPFTLSYKPSES